jgi:DNA-binding CsgD family transcriptional regulator/tetratricopeptide (TPR) repeat protein
VRGVGALVGRNPERQALVARLADAVSTHGQLVLVAGEPGIGKTRLAEELANAAAPVPVAWGRASQDEGSPPYWIFRQVAGRLGSELPAALAHGSVDRDSAQARFTAFETFTEQIGEWARAAGLLMILDDLQWVDDASLALLAHLTESLTHFRLMVIATYRDTETAGRPALTSTLAALARVPTLTRIRLRGLPAEDVARQIQVLTGSEVPPAMAATVSRRTGGNPFFIGELARLVDATPEALPDAVLDTLRVRLAGLSATCREIVTTAAALGATVEPVALATVTGRDAAAVLTALDEANAAGFITHTNAWRFRHDLIREAAHLELPTAARLEAHAAYAHYLQSRGDAHVNVSQIAHHLLASLPVGDALEAARWAERAGDQARARLAWEQGAELYAHALDLTRDVPDRARLLLRYATALTCNGDMRRAAEALAECATAARELDDPHLLGDVALVTEGLSDSWDDFGSARIALEALARLPDEDSTLRARLLAQLAGAASLNGGADPETTSAEALAMAERLGDPHVLRSALRARQLARCAPDGVHERLALAARMMAIGVAERDDDALLWGRLWRFDALMMLGRLDEAEGELAPMRHDSDRLHRPLASWHYLRNRAVMQTCRGGFDDALDSVQRSLNVVDTRAHGAVIVSSMSILMWISALTGRPDLITPAQADAMDHAIPQPLRWIWSYYYLLLGDMDRARAVRARTDINLDETAPRVVVPLLLPILAANIELAATFDAPEEVAPMTAWLRPYADMFVTGGAGVVTNSGSARTYLALAEAAQGRLDNAVRESRLGIAANDAAGITPYSALARFQLARVLARRRRPGDLLEADSLSAVVVDVATRLGMTPLRHRAQSLISDLRGHSTDRLTAREREVADHVAQGLTNKQIGALMHISERTVETHIQHLLGKLGAANRTQIAVKRGEPH